MNKHLIHGLSALLASSCLIACGSGDIEPVMTLDSHGVSTFDIEVLRRAVTRYPSDPLSKVEVESLAFMREQEQLMHDVYAANAGLWSVDTFAWVAEGEASHSAAVKVLIERYHQADPLDGLTHGHFKTPAFQNLHDSLVAASRLSPIEALTVAVEVQELGIRDLSDQRDKIDNADILMVYDNLLDASQGHLLASMKVLTANGGQYVPKYIPQDTFDTLMK